MKAYAPALLTPLFFVLFLTSCSKHNDTPPNKAADTKAASLAAVESVLKTYRSILQQKPDAKAKALDDLLKKQSQGKLKDSVKQCP